MLGIFGRWIGLKTYPQLQHMCMQMVALIQSFPFLRKRLETIYQRSTFGMASEPMWQPQLSSPKPKKLNKHMHMPKASALKKGLFVSQESSLHQQLQQAEEEQQLEKAAALYEQLAEASPMELQAANCLAKEAKNVSQMERLYTKACQVRWPDNNV